jgi:hypothetical protein
MASDVEECHYIRVVNLFRPRTTFTLSHQLTSRKVINEDNLLKCHDNLLNLFNLQFHILLNNFL